MHTSPTPTFSWVGPLVTWDAATHLEKFSPFSVCYHSKKKKKLNTIYKYWLFFRSSLWKGARHLLPQIAFLVTIAAEDRLFWSWQKGQDLSHFYFLFFCKKLYVNGLSFHSLICWPNYFSFFFFFKQIGSLEGYILSFLCQLFLRCIQGTPICIKPSVLAVCD